MTEQWESFPCRIDDDAAFIAVDVGIKDELQGLGYDHAVKIEITLKAPDSNGMPSPKESQALDRVDDAIASTCEDNSWAYVGRRTWRGQRDVFIYANDSDRLITLLQDLIVQRFGYEAGFGVRKDRSCGVYRSEIYPTKHDWQVIHNEHVLRALSENGDDGTVPRRIDHWVEFTIEEHRAGFLKMLQGFDVVNTDDPDGASSVYVVRLTHRAAPIEMHRTAIELGYLVREFDGDYDGWETEVVTGDQA